MVRAQTRESRSSTRRSRGPCRGRQARRWLPPPPGPRLPWVAPSTRGPTLIASTTFTTISPPGTKLPKSGVSAGQWWLTDCIFYYYYYLLFCRLTHFRSIAFLFTSLLSAARIVPLGVDGLFRYSARDPAATARITHLMLEQDSGKSLADDMPPWLTFVDLNRAGTALMEIVTGTDSIPCWVCGLAIWY